MSWNDGITKELSDYLKEFDSVAVKSVDVAKSVIDGEAKGFHQTVHSLTPVDSGKLKESLVFEAAHEGYWYGYNVEYKGSYDNGEPFEKIANIINYGTPYKDGSFFISNAIRKLRGMTDRINARIDAEITKIEEKE